MALYHITRTVGLQELWVQKGNVFLSCHQIAERLAVHANMDASQITSILMSVYVFTGCDTDTCTVEERNAHVKLLSIARSI